MYRGQDGSFVPIMARMPFVISLYEHQYVQKRLLMSAKTQ